MQDQTGASSDKKERQILLSLDLSKRALETESIDDLYFLIANDIRALLSYDRCMIVSHLGGVSQLVAAGNRPEVEKRAKIYEALERFGTVLRNSSVPILLAGRNSVDDIPDDKLDPTTKEALTSYMEFSGCNGIFCVPLVNRKETLAHVILEYFDAGLPDQIEVLTIINTATFLAAAMAQKYLQQRTPGIGRLTEFYSWKDRPVPSFLFRHWYYLAGVVSVLSILLFVVPFDFTVGGEAEVAPKIKYVAFCKMEGLVDRILVQEGAEVKQDQILAKMDTTEMDHKIRISEKQIQLLHSEAMLLKKSAFQDLAKLAESHLVSLKQHGQELELEFLKWLSQFSSIRSPVEGVVLSKNVETLVGKKFKAGEPFCEIAPPGELWIEVFVPEDRAMYVQPGHAGELFLNSEPLKAYPLKVREIAPRAETFPRLGTVYRVRAALAEPLQTLRAGMKGIGKIRTGETTVWETLTRRAQFLWNRILPYL
jgi:multidrug resistance efflux pump